MERLEIKQTNKQLDVKEADLSKSQIFMAMLKDCHFENVTLAGTKIMDADLSDLEIEGAQIGGGYIHNIGMPPKGHPMYDPAAKMRPVVFEDCALIGSIFQNCNMSGVTVTDCNLGGVTIADCNLSGVALRDCNITGMTIEGIPVEELLQAYRK
jgi:uncharacterized protein YjbI with pentapeptide repeats